MAGMRAVHKKNGTTFKYSGDLKETILKAAVEEIYTGRLAKVTLNLRGGGQSINFTECKG